MAPRNPNISVSFNGSSFQREVNGMKDSLTAVKKEFEVTNLAIQANGSELDLARNKIEGYAKQAEIQRSITNKVREAVEQAAKAHAAAGQRVEAARQEYEKASKSENASVEQVAKLKKELDSASNTYDKLGKTVQAWNNKLLDSQKAENKLALAVKQTNDEIEKHNKKLSDTAQSTSNVVTGTGQLHNAFSLLYGLAVGYAGKTLYEALIGDNAKFEQYMASFEVLLNGADNAKRRMEELTQFAAKTPFLLPQVVEAEKRLLAYGVAVKDTQKTLQMLGDISMGSAEKLNMISLAYGQVITNQKLYGSELRQFAENGVPLLAELAQMYGKTEAEMRKMVEEGQISADAVTAALMRMTSEGGKFNGMMEKQSQTMQGVLSNLKDNIDMFARDVGNKSFTALKGELDGLMDALDNMKESGELGDIAAEWGRNIAELVKYIVDAVKILWDMKEALAAVGIAIVAFKTAMAIGNTIIAVTSAIEAYTTAVKAGSTATTAFTAVMKVNPWVLLASAIAAVVTAVIGYNLITQDATKETDKLAEKTADLTEEYERNQKAADRQANSQQGEVVIAQKLAGELEQLSSKTNKTAEEKARMAQIVDQLNSKIPTLALEINNETGELNKQIGVVYDTIEAYKQLLFVKANEKRASAAADSLVDLQKQKADLESQIAPYKEVIDQIEKYKMAQFFMAQGLPPPTNLQNAKFHEISQKELNKYNSLAEQLNTINGLIDDANGKIQESFDSTKAYTEKYGAGALKTRTTVEPPPLVTDPEKAKKSAEDAVKKAEQARKEAIQKEFNDLKFARDMEYITDADYYTKVAELRDRYFEAGSSDWQKYTLDIKQHNDQLVKDAEEAAKKAQKAQEDAFKARRQDSTNWITDQKFYGNLTPKDEIAAYERVRTYVEQYYKDGVISFEEYQGQIRDLDKNIYSVRKSYLEDYAKTYADVEKKNLDTRKKAIEEEAKSDKENFSARKKAIEEYYSAMDRQDKQQDRAKSIAELREQERIYASAATKEGMEHLDKIRKDIESLNKEAVREQRELTKKAEIAALDEKLEAAEADRAKRLKTIEAEYNNLDTTQKTLLGKIGEYATTATSAIEQSIQRIQQAIAAMGNLAGPIAAAATQTAGNGNKTAPTVILNDYGNKILNKAVDTVNYGKELLTTAAAVLRGD